MEPKTKQSLLVTVVGVTLFVALLRLSDVLAFAAKLIDLVLPILAGGILALFINVPMTGLEKRLNRLFGKAKKFGGVLRALEEVAAGPVDRDSPRQRRRIRMLPAMNGERFKTDRHYYPPYPAQGRNRRFGKMS